MMNQYHAVIFVTLAVAVYAFPIYEQYNEFPVKQYNEFPPVKRSCRNSSVTLYDDDLIVLQKFMGFFSSLMQNRYYGKDMPKNDPGQMTYNYNNNIGKGYDPPKYQKTTTASSMTSTTTPVTTTSTTTSTTTTTTTTRAPTTTTTTKASTTGLTIDPKLLESIMRNILCNCTSPNHSVGCNSFATRDIIFGTTPTTTKATTTTTTTPTTTTTKTIPTITTTTLRSTTTTSSVLPTKPKKRLCFKTLCIKVKDDKGYFY